ncbi:SRPBCC family protein [Psychrobium sp. nBUS_13]|uniref:SRPBCC family protein n=1 Tax=Psychrobium sp. nBUS_13 TaxID=3395319 RepID=UPI003EB85694
MLTISLTKSINASADDVHSALLDHEQLGRFFNGSFSVKQPATCSTGVGLIREITMRGEKFCEEVIAVTQRCIHYRIIGNKPVRNHYGSIHIIDSNDGCKINYLITCQALWWQPSFIVKKIINQDMSQGLTKLAEHLNGRSINSSSD